MPKIQYDAKGFPIYDKNDGWKSYDQFEAAALNDMARISNIGKTQKTLQTPQGPIQVSTDPNEQSTGSKLAHLSGRIASATLPAAGSSAALMGLDAVAPEAGIPATILSSILGAGGGSVLKQAIQEKFPGLFGNAPQSMVGKSADVLTDAALQGLVPGIAKAGAEIPLKGVAGRIAGNLLGSKTISVLPKASPQVIDLLHVLGTMPRIQSEEHSQ